jgi:LuxR family maltose regulon positive regulatory protein
VPRPGLFDRLAASARVTVVSAPPGSGKTVLLRSWIGEAGLEDSAAWVPGGPDERDPQRFWLTVLGALRQTSAGSALVRAVTAALSLAGHPDPERFAAEFSGCERTVAEYLLAEVLERQGEEVRRLLLRTCLVERVSGELADALTGVRAGIGSCRTWRPRTRSWCRWTRRGRGSATTGCSPGCCNWSCGAPPRVR